MVQGRQGCQCRLGMHGRLCELARLDWQGRFNRHKRLVTQIRKCEQGKPGRLDKLVRQGRLGRQDRLCRQGRKKEKVDKIG